MKTNVCQFSLVISSVCIESGFNFKTGTSTFLQLFSFSPLKHYCDKDFNSVSQTDDAYPTVTCHKHDINSGVEKYVRKNCATFERVMPFLTFHL